ncbi:sigma-70 family RNA polymerase sigma factor [Bremerella sp. T1]|uniref:sigma-70 family RNA polymerase sigma factor n=1 Tax=Bremerella sp. TYQ1 TaxID=3119568 RepID=UPI001CCB79B5|nr:sigma-70 family RNA polymerase sigma factor [Bremerella volcania]UBM35417.1 sigma-70 family RNA polymerase sigma factor [Bremerella volcania]
MPMDDSNRNQRFVRIFTQHEPAVRAFVRRLVPSRTDADDILQEVAVVLWEKFDEFQPDRDFRAWACGIARYKVLSWLRDRGRAKLVLDSDVVELVAEESLRIDRHLEQQRTALEVCFEKVQPDQRSLLKDAYREGAKIQDIATNSGRSVSGFYQWLYRMRQMLLDCVKRELAQESIS